MKVYTKTGDKGETSLLSGSRVQKSDSRIEAYGTVVELNAHIGLANDLIDITEVSDFLTGIQEYLFTIGSHLADDGKKDYNLPELGEDFVISLEEKIDLMSEVTGPMKNFILPGGHQVISQLHIARTVCRRAERRIIILASDDKRFNLIIRYLNRLSY